MVNTDYRVEAIGFLLHEDCLLKGYYPLIPHRDALVERLLQMGCERKSDVMRLPDEGLMQAGVPQEGLGLFRKFLVMYDPRAQKMREIASVSHTPEEAACFKELYLLPGVKSTRARLYVKSGFASLADVANASAEGLVTACGLAIAKENLPMKVPLLKEVRTHIAVAKAFTDKVEG